MSQLSTLGFLLSLVLLSSGSFAAGKGQGDERLKYPKTLVTCVLTNGEIVREHFLAEDFEVKISEDLGRMLITGEAANFSRFATGKDCYYLHRERTLTTLLCASGSIEKQSVDLCEAAN